MVQELSFNFDNKVYTARLWDKKGHRYYIKRDGADYATFFVEENEMSRSKAWPSAGFRAAFTAAFQAALEEAQADTRAIEEVEQIAAMAEEDAPIAQPVARPVPTIDIKAEYQEAFDKLFPGVRFTRHLARRGQDNTNAIFTNEFEEMCWAVQAEIGEMSREEYEHKMAFRRATQARFEARAQREHEDNI